MAVTLKEGNLFPAIFFVPHYTTVRTLSPRGSFRIPLIQPINKDHLSRWKIISADHFIFQHQLFPSTYPLNSQRNSFVIFICYLSIGCLTSLYPEKRRGQKILEREFHRRLKTHSTKPVFCVWHTNQSQPAFQKVNNCSIFRYREFKIQ